MPVALFQCRARPCCFSSAWQPVQRASEGVPYLPDPGAQTRQTGPAHPHRAAWQVSCTVDACERTNENAIGHHVVALFPRPFRGPFLARGGAGSGFPQAGRGAPPTSAPFVIPPYPAIPGSHSFGLRKTFLNAIEIAFQVCSHAFFAQGRFDKESVPPSGPRCPLRTRNAPPTAAPMPGLRGSSATRRSVLKP